MRLKRIPRFWDFFGYFASLFAPEEKVNIVPVNRGAT